MATAIVLPAFAGPPYLTDDPQPTDTGHYETNCEIHRGSDARDFRLFSLATTKQALEHLQMGAELYHQTPDAAGSRAVTDVDFGVTYDIDPHLHLMGSIGSGLQNRVGTERTIRYAALLWTL